MRDEASKVKQTTIKAKQHSTPKAVTSHVQYYMYVHVQFQTGVCRGNTIVICQSMCNVHAVTCSHGDQ